MLIAFKNLEGAARILILLGLAYTKNQEKLKEIL